MNVFTYFSSLRQATVSDTEDLYSLHNDSLKCIFWKGLDKLCKNIFPVVHSPNLLMTSKVKIQVVDMHLWLYFA
jgi:hypothetical protein